MSENERETTGHRKTPQHPLWLSVLLSLYHVWTPWRWPQIAVGFLPLSLVPWRTRSIYVSMIAHVTINIVFLVMLRASFVAG